MIFRNKKKGLAANDILLFIIEWSLVVLTLITMLSFVNTLAKGTLIEKNLISKDLALVLNTIQASPNTVLTHYFFDNIDLSKFTFDFTNGAVSVADIPTEDAPKPFPKRYKYGMSDSIRLLDNEINLVERYSRFEIANNGKSLSIENGLTINGELFCEPPSTYTFGKLIIDPSHGGDDKGFIDGEKKESEIVLSYAKALDNKLGMTTSATRAKEFNYDNDVAARLLRFQYIYNFANENDIIVSLHLGQYDKTLNFVKIYVPMNANPITKGIACQFLNKLILLKVNNAQLYDDIAILEVNQNKIDRESDMAILLHPNSMLIEIGNINRDLNTIASPDVFATKFKEVIDEYKPTG